MQCLWVVSSLWSGYTMSRHLCTKQTHSSNWQPPTQWYGRYLSVCVFVFCFVLFCFFFCFKTYLREMQIWSKASQMSRTNEKCNYETNSVVKTQIIVILRAKFLKGFQETNCSGYMLFERVFLKSPVLHFVSWTRMLSIPFTYSENWWGANLTSNLS